MKKRVVSATEFKAKCLALLDEVDEQGTAITVTKRGRPVAVVSRAPKKAWKSLKGSWAGRMKIVGDIVNTNWDWEVMRESKD
jgi:prevent-host-death family protein